jgi:hypothetical protein
MLLWQLSDRRHRNLTASLLWQLSDRRHRNLTASLLLQLSDRRHSLFFTIFVLRQQQERWTFQRYPDRRQLLTG